MTESEGSLKGVHLHDHPGQITGDGLGGDFDHPKHDEQIDHIDGQRPPDAQEGRHQTEDNDCPGGTGGKSNGKSGKQSFPPGPHDSGGIYGGNIAAVPRIMGIMALPCNPI